MAKIQVKTTMINRFIFNEKAEKLISDDFFYAFVKMKDMENIEYWIVPANEVASYAKVRYKKRMEYNPAFNPTTIRNFTVKKDRFEIFFNPLSIYYINSFIYILLR